MKTEIIVKNSIPGFISAYQRLADLRSQIRALREEIESGFKNQIEYDYFLTQYDRDGWEEGRCDKYTRSKFWLALISETPLFSSMSEKARREFEKKIEDNPPPFTPDDISALAQNIDRLYVDNSLQVVTETYSRLIDCHYNGAHWNIRDKRDNRQGVKTTFRISGNLRWCSYSHKFEYRDDWYNSFCYEDLLTCCYLIDGKSKPAHNSNLTFRSLSFAQLSRECDTVSTPYFTVKCFINGNQLVRWQADQIHVLNKLNRHGSDGSLPDTMSKRYKPEHFTN